MAYQNRSNQDSSSEQGRRKMEEVVFYSQEVHEQVALYITRHGGKVQVERVDPAWVFHKVTIPLNSERRIGGGDSSPIYKCILADGGVILSQTLRHRGFVPGHPNHYWHALYIYKEEENGKGATEPRRRTYLSDGL